MKQVFTKMKLLVIVLIAFCGMGNMFAQVIIPDGSNLSEFFKDYLDEDGKLSEKVFQLVSEGVYMISESVYINDDFTLQGAKGEGRPPIILPTRTVSDEYVNTWFVFENGIGTEIVFENIIFQMLPMDGLALNINIRYIAAFIAENQRIIMDGVVINAAKDEAIVSEGNGQYVKITNSIIRNSGAADNNWEGGFVDISGSHAGWKDSLIFIDNTIISSGGGGINSFWGEVSKGVLIDHNTFFCVEQGSFFAGFQGNVQVTNNLFIAPQLAGYPIRELIARSANYF